MNICQVGTGFTSIPPRVSAATEEVIFNLSKELIAQRCDVTVVDILDRRRPANGLPIVELPYLSYIKTTKSNSLGLIARRISFSLFSTMWLHRFKECYDVVHFHNQFPASMFNWFSRLSSKENPAIFYTLHNPVWGLPDLEMPKEVMLKFVLEVDAMKRSDKVIVVSETLRRNVLKRLKLDPSSVVVIPNGVNVSSFHPGRASSLLRKELAPNGEKIVLCVGRICRYKGQKTLVDSIPKITKENPNVKFIFVGPVDDVQYFKIINDTIDSMSLRKYCVFKGTVPSDQVPKYFATADICTVLSITEAGPPLTLLQAMSSARAIVASSIPQNFEAAKQGNEIIFVDPLNVDEISSVIARLLYDDDVRAAMGEKARNTVLGNYDWKVTAEKTLRLYQNVRGK